MTVLFVGCSYTKGEGLPLESADQNLWVNRLHANVSELRNQRLINVARGGHSNPEIFADAVRGMVCHEPTQVFVAWTAYPRYRFDLALETYSTELILTASNNLDTVCVNPGTTYDAGYLNSIKDRFLSLHHDHYGILQVLFYTDCLARLAQKLKVRIFFVNALLPWDSDYFTHLQAPDRVPSSTTPYTQSILNARTRDDDEFWCLYDRIHREYDVMQTVHHCWLNLYRSFRQDFMLDRGTDHRHPGPISHAAFAEYLTDCLQQCL